MACAQLFLLRFNLLYLLPDVAALQYRDGCACFLTVGSSLQTVQLGAFVDMLLQLLLAHGCLDSAHLGSSGLLVCLLLAGLRQQGYQHLMGVVQQIVFNNAFVIVGFQALAQSCQIFVVTEALNRIAVIQPVIHNADAQNQSLGIAAEICLTQLEFHGVDVSLQQFFINAVDGDVLQCFINNTNKFIAQLLLTAAGTDREYRLIHAGGIAAVDNLAYACIHQRTAQCGGFAVQQCAFQQAQSHAGLQVGCLACYDRKLVICFGSAVLLCPNRIKGFNIRSTHQWLLLCDGGINSTGFLEAAQIFAVKIFQSSVDIHITV